MKQEQAKKTIFTDEHGVPSSSRAIAIWFSWGTIAVAMVACFSPMWNANPNEYVAIIGTLATVSVGGKFAGDIGVAQKSKAHANNFK